MTTPWVHTDSLNKQSTRHCDLLSFLSFFFLRLLVSFGQNCQGILTKGWSWGKNLLGHPKSNTSHTLMKEANFIGLSALLRGGSACNTWARHVCVQLNSTLCTARWSPPPKAKASSHCNENTESKLLNHLRSPLLCDLLFNLVHANSKT